MAYEHIIVETRGRVGLITLNRPKALNALSPALMQELSDALDGFDPIPNFGSGLRDAAKKLDKQDIPHKDRVAGVHREVKKARKLLEGAKVLTAIEKDLSKYSNKKIYSAISNALDRITEVVV